MGKGLIVAQVALSLVLLAGAGLFIRTLEKLQAVDLGFHAHGVLDVSLYPKPNGYKNLDRVSYYRELTENKPDEAEMGVRVAIQEIVLAHRRRYGYRRVTALLRAVGLEEFARALPRQLSGGMAQRVAIARALATRPEVLLLDEPFSSVDAFTRMHLQDLLLAIWQQESTTMVLVTHEIDEALYLSDRVLVLSGRPARLRAEVRVEMARPRDRRSAQLARLKAGVLTGVAGAVEHVLPAVAGVGVTLIGWWWSVRSGKRCDISPRR